MLQFRFPAHVGGGLRELHEHWERDVDQANDRKDEVAENRHDCLVLPGNPEGGCHRELLPSQAGMRHKNQDSDDVERSPHAIAENLILELEDVANGNRFYLLVVRPEESQLEKPHGLQIDEQGWRAQIILLCRSESELEQMNGHEGQKGQS